MTKLEQCKWCVEKTRPGYDLLGKCGWATLNMKTLPNSITTIGWAEGTLLNVTENWIEPNRCRSCPCFEKKTN